MTYLKKLIILILLLTLSLTFIACEQKDDNDYAGEKLSYTEMINGDGSVAKRWYYKYNPDGEVSTSTRCEEDGSCIQRNEYTYNENNLIDTEIIYIYGKKTSVTEYTYTDDGKIKTEKVYRPDSITEKIIYYNSDGSEDFTETLDASGKIIGIKRCIYDDAGNKIKERFYNENDTQTGGIEYTYEGSKLIMKEYINGALDEFSKEEYTYDGENITKTLLYDKSGKLLYIDTAEYEEDRCMHRTRFDSNNSIVYTWDAYYDSFLTLIG